MTSSSPKLKLIPNVGKERSIAPDLLQVRYYRQDNGQLKHIVSIGADIADSLGQIKKIGDKEILSLSFAEDGNGGMYVVEPVVGSEFQFKRKRSMQRGRFALYGAALCRRFVKNFGLALQKSSLPYEFQLLKDERNNIYKIVKL